MSTHTTYVSREHLYVLGVDEATGRPYLSIPVSNSVADYSERYGISPEELERFLADGAAAAAFAAACRARTEDSRLLEQPGWNRGTPRMPAADAGPPAPAVAAPPAPERAAATDGATTIRAAMPPAGTWFGPESDEPAIAARPHMALTAPLDERVAAVAAAVRAGDLSGRESLVDLLHDREESLSVRLQAQRLLVLVARDQDFAERTTFRYLDDAEPEIVEAFAGLGKLALARSAVDVLVRVGRAGWEDQDVRRAVVPSLLVLVDRTEAERREPPTLVSLARSAVRTFADESAAYLLKGAPWSPASIVERMRAGARRAHAAGELYGNWFLAADLAVWSGIPGPYLKDALLTDDELAAIVAWADALEALPWVPGRKYVHGHDVDGGPSLR